MNWSDKSSSESSGLSPVGYIAIGVGLLFIAGILIAAGIGDEYDFATGQSSTSYGAAFWFGMIFAALGWVVALIGVIAQGVKVGNRHS